MTKRLFDVIFSFLGLIILFPLFVFVSILILVSSRGGFIYCQRRVGQNNKEFNLIKFRTMSADSEKRGLITIGINDNRITGIGRVLRRYKIDELPQLINILKNDMSIVGPRPEVRKYVDLYTANQLKVLSVKPGLTDYASLEFTNENAILGEFPDPEQAYINEIMPAKLKLNLLYIKEQGLLTDIKIVIKTVRKILF